MSSARHESGLKESDLNEFFLAYDGEFDKEELHDRVLIFDVVRDERQTNVVSTDEAPELKGLKAEPVHIAREQISPSTLVEGRQTEGDSQPEHGKVLDRKRHLKDAEKPLSSNSLKKYRVECDIASDIEDGGITNLVQEETTNNKNMSETIAESEVVLRQHKIFVHATFLAVHSQYFRALFYSGMKEATSKEVHIKMQESEEQSHLKMLEAIYRPYVLDNLTLEELLQILELADKYDITYVFRKCKYVLQKRKLTVDDCEKITNTVEIKQKMPRTADLVAAVTEFLSSEFSPLDTHWHDKMFSNLSETLLRILLNSEGLETISENTVFHAMMYWIVRNGYNFHRISKETASPLLTLVKFELLTIDYLYHFVQHHRIAKEMPGFSELYLKGITYHALSTSMKETILARPKPSEETIQYTWLITRDEIDFARNGQSTTDDAGIKRHIKSLRFWWCGYQMQMVISDIHDQMYATYLSAKLHLHVYNLKERSKLQVKWYISSAGLSPGKSTYFHTTFSFAMQTSIQNVKMQKNSESGVPPQFVHIGICISDP